MKTITSKMLSVIAMAMVVGCAFTACNNTEKKIEYKTAEGYFVRNTIKNEGAYEKKFTTKEEFDTYFGTATTMDAAPTAIDFDKEYAAAFIAPETDRETTITVDSLIWNGSKAEMWITMKAGAPTSYTIRPVKILLIDKQYDGGVTSFVTGYEQ